MSELAERFFAAWDAHVAANERTNAAIPAIQSTPAERAVYDERYRASEQAKRDWFAAATALAQAGREALSNREDGWIDWTGGECPVLDCVRVDIRFRDGREECNTSPNGGWSWHHFPAAGRITPDGDIIAYRLSDAPA